MIMLNTHAFTAVVIWTLTSYLGHPMYILAHQNWFLEIVSVPNLDSLSVPSTKSVLSVRTVSRYNRDDCKELTAKIH